MDELDNGFTIDLENLIADNLSQVAVGPVNLGSEKQTICVNDLARGRRYLVTVEREEA